MVDVQYREFYESLRGKLQGLEEERNALLEEIAEYDKFEEIYYETKVGDVRKTHVDIGENVFVQAEVSGAAVKKPFLHIGLGVHVQFPNEDAMLDFMERRKALLSTKAEYIATKIEMMKVDVSQMEDMLAALQALS